MFAYVGKPHSQPSLWPAFSAHVVYKCTGNPLVMLRLLPWNTAAQATAQASIESCWRPIDQSSKAGSVCTEQSTHRAASAEQPVSTAWSQKT